MTGYSLKTDVSEPKKLHEDLRRIEIDNDKIEFYFNELTEKRKCLNLEFSKDIEVSGVAPASAKAYDYYAPGKANGELIYSVDRKSSSDGQYGSKSSKLLMPKYGVFIFGFLGLLLG